MPVHHDQCLEMAHELVQARQRVTCVAAPSARGEDLTLADAYVVAACVEDEWSRAGHRPNGVKIGLTDVGKWPALGVSAPVWGRTYAESTSEDMSVPVDLDAFLAPRIEAEVVVGLARDLEPGASPTDVADAIAWAALGFEVVDCHIEGWQVTVSDLVADFGAHAGLVIGGHRNLTPSEIMELDRVRVELTNGDASVVRGGGDTVVGSPVQAIVALLAAPHAPIITGGSLISTGALTGGAHPVAGGERWYLEPVSGPLPPVFLTLSANGGLR